MQKLQVELTNIPRNTPQVSCSINSQLNKDESSSVENKVLACNNPDVDQSCLKDKKKHFILVFILNKKGEPLMPCSPRKAKKLLKEKKAKVVKRIPFTIQLLYGSSGYKQEISLGIDIGYKTIGFSAITISKELISGEILVDNKEVEKLKKRNIYRRNRRNKLWYRAPRFLNRVSSKKEIWLPPSIERRYQTHLNLISRLKKILPISKINIEVAKFDIQKLENSNIRGSEYQQGDLYQYRNRISYLIAREKGKCQYCNKEYKQGDPWRLHHIWGKQKDRSQDWALVHESCHMQLHKNKEEHKLQNKKSKSYKESTFMSIIRNRFFKDLPEAEFTYGNITFQNRIELGLEKSHINDAFVIAKGKNQIRCKQFILEQKRKNNRCLQINRKGYKPSIRKNRYKYQPKDLIKICNTIYEVSGTHSYGTYIFLKKLNKKMINKAVKDLDNYHFYQGTLKWSIAK